MNIIIIIISAEGCSNHRSNTDIAMRISLSNVPLGLILWASLLAFYRSYLIQTNVSLSIHSYDSVLYRFTPFGLALCFTPFSMHLQLGGGWTKWMWKGG